MKTESKIALSGVVISTSVIFAYIFVMPFFFSASDIPHVSLEKSIDIIPVYEDEEGNVIPIDDAPGLQKPKKVTGEMRYDLVIVYKDGFRKTFTETIQFPDLTFSVADQNNKEIDRFEFTGYARLNVPQEIADQVRTNANVATDVRVLFNGIEVKNYQTSRPLAVSTLESGYKLFDVHVTADEIESKVGNGVYALVFSDQEKIAFQTADYEEKVMMIEATPLFTLEKDAGLLKAIGVVTVKPSASTSLEKIPHWGKQYVSGTCPGGVLREDGTWSKPVPCQQLVDAVVGYTTDVVITASNFKPLSSINFDYTYSAKAAEGADGNIKSNRMIPYVVLTKQTDVFGSAEDRYHYNALYAPECAFYYTLFKISDGENEARGKSGCNAYQYSIRNCACAEATWERSAQKKYEEDFLAGKID